ncbi:MAG: hypothetical protein QXQ46_06960 [Thermoplasmatales archaeon]
MDKSLEKSYFGTKPKEYHPAMSKSIGSFKFSYGPVMMNKIMQGRELR